jgi:hypothetical protein
MTNVVAAPEIMAAMAHQKSGGRIKGLRRSEDELVILGIFHGAQDRRHF